MSIGASTSPSPSGPVWCIVVAGGSGRRFGTLKQFEVLAGLRVIDRSVAAASSVSDGVVAVVPSTVAGTVDGEVLGADRVVAGGDTRSASVRAGLRAVPRDAAVVLVHDAARPLASADLFGRVVAAVRAGAAAVVPVVPVTDTVRHVGGGVVDRDSLRSVQTPQGFRAVGLREAHARDGDASDDAGLVEQAGGTVVLVDGETTNLKITEQQDLVIAEALLGSTDPSPPLTQPSAGVGPVAGDGSGDGQD